MRPVYVRGVGLHPFGRFPDRSLTEIGALAVRAALREAGLERGGFQAAFCGCVYGGVAAGHKVLTALGLSGPSIVNVEAGCASGGAALALAAAQIAAGACDDVLVFGMENTRGSSFLSRSARDRARHDACPQRYGPGDSCWRRRHRRGSRRRVGTEPRARRPQPERHAPPRHCGRCWLRCWSAAAAAAMLTPNEGMAISYCLPTRTGAIRIAPRSAVLSRRLSARTHPLSGCHGTPCPRRRSWRPNLLRKHQAAGPADRGRYNAARQPAPGSSGCAPAPVMNWSGGGGSALVLPVARRRAALEGDRSALGRSGQIVSWWRSFAGRSPVGC
jgi:hypothetical protein